MVEVFKTNVQDAGDASRIVAFLQERFPSCQVSFDLEDCDKILRIAGADVCAKEISEYAGRLNFHCVRLAD